MLSTSIALAIATLAPIDSARKVADTLFIEPLGMRATVPALWMGRVPEGATMLAPGQGRFGCQLNVTTPASERVVTDPAQFSTIIRGIYGNEVRGGPALRAAPTTANYESLCSRTSRVDWQNDATHPRILAAGVMSHVNPSRPYLYFRGKSFITLQMDHNP